MLSFLRVIEYTAEQEMLIIIPIGRKDSIRE